MSHINYVFDGISNEDGQRAINYLENNSKTFRDIESTAESQGVKQIRINFGPHDTESVKLDDGSESEIPELTKPDTDDVRDSWTVNINSTVVGGYVEQNADGSSTPYVEPFEIILAHAIAHTINTHYDEIAGRDRIGSSEKDVIDKQNAISSEINSSAGADLPTNAVADKSSYGDVDTSIAQGTVVSSQTKAWRLLSNGNTAMGSGDPALSKQSPPSPQPDPSPAPSPSPSPDPSPAPSPSPDPSPAPSPSPDPLPAPSPDPSPAPSPSPDPSPAPSPAPSPDPNPPQTPYAPPSGPQPQPTTPGSGDSGGGGTTPGSGDGGGNTPGGSDGGGGTTPGGNDGGGGTTPGGGDGGGYPGDPEEKSVTTSLQDGQSLDQQRRLGGGGPDGSGDSKVTLAAVSPHQGGSHDQHPTSDGQGSSVSASSATSAAHHGTTLQAIQLTSAIAGFNPASSGDTGHTADQTETHTTLTIDSSRTPLHQAARQVS